MRVTHDRLGICVGDNPNALVPKHLVDVGGELGLELCVLDVVDVEVHHVVVDGAQTGTTGTKM